MLNDECTVAESSHGLRSTSVASATQCATSSDVSTVLSVEESFEKYCSESSNINLDKVLTFQSFTLSTFLVNHGSTPVSQDSKGFEHTVRRLLMKVHDEVNYHKQSMIILKQEVGTKPMKDTLLSLDKVVSVLVIERTSSSQVYAVKDLDSFPHFTLLTSDVPEFQSALKQFGRRDFPVMFVPSSVSYDNGNEGTHVVNHRGNDSKNELLSKIKCSFLKLFDLGLGDKFTLSDQGRGDVFFGQKEEAIVGISVKERSIPTISFGYSSQDAKQYSNNRMSIVGHTKPEIRDGDLSPEAKTEVYDLIITILSSKIGSKCFLRSGLNENELHVRRHLQCLLASNLKGDEDVDRENSRAEGGTFLVPAQIAPHLDKGNSSVASLNDALIATCLLPTDVVKRHNVNNDTKNKKFIDLHDALSSRGFKKKFPLALALYTRNNLDKIVDKVVILNNLKSKDDLHSVFVWAITERMNSIVDYRGFVMEQTNFLDFFKERAAMDKVSRKVQMNEYDTINKTFFKLPAAYDRMGYWSIIYDLFITLSVCILDSPTVKDTIDFIIYSACCCNGTSVPWRVVDTIMMNVEQSRSNLEYKFDGNFFQFLVAMDTKTAEDQYSLRKQTQTKEVKVKVEELEKGPRSRGNCQWNRFTYSPHSSNITVSDKFRQQIVDLINDPNCTRTKKKKSSKKKPTVTHYQKMIELLMTQDGIGNFLAQNAMNLFALFGLTPLSWYFDASIPGWSEKTGPVKLLKLVYPDYQSMDITPDEIYRSLHSQFNAVFPGGKVTMNVLESAGCEVYRCYVLTSSRMIMNVDSDEETIYKVTCVEDDSVRVESRKYDVYYYMDYRKAPQNLFSVEMSRPGVTKSCPAIFIRDVTSSDKSLKYVTNWKGKSHVDDTNLNHMYWMKDDNDRISVNTALFIDSEIHSLYKTNDMVTKSVSSPPKSSRRKDLVTPSPSKRTQRGPSKRPVRPTNFFAKEFGKQNNVCTLSDLDSDYIFEEEES